MAKTYQSAVSGTIARTGDSTLDNALQVINKNIEAKIDHDGELDLIQRLFEEGFEVKDPKGSKKIGSKTLQQALWRMVSKMKFLDFQIHGAGRDEVLEKIVTDGVATVAEEGGLSRSLRDKGGAFWSLALYGDGFIYTGTDPNNEYPIQFSPISPSNLYVDNYATGFRSGGIGKDVTECVVVYSMSPEEAEKRYGEEFPKIKKAKGKIKRYLALDKEQERTFQQEERVEPEMVEVAFYYNINKKEYLVFAGTNNVILNKLKGDKYPFVKDEEPYIPISQFICQPSSKGFWNFGIGHMLYDLAIITRRMINMGVGHVDENVYPITLVNVPQGEAAEFFNKLQLAHEMRAAGKKGMVAMEYDPANPGAGRVGADALITQSTLMSEWQIILQRLDRELTRLGIYLDDLDRGSNITAHQVVAEEENASQFVKQIMEYNASECQFIVELTMDFIKKFIKVNNDTPLNLTTDLGEDVDAKGFTMGALADELKKNNYFVKVNARSGAIASNIMKISQINRQLQVTPPGSPAYNKLVTRLAALGDLDLKIEDYAPPQQEAPMQPPQNMIKDELAPEPSMI